jgi:hypothetical protein
MVFSDKIYWPIIYDSEAKSSWSTVRYEGIKDVLDPIDLTLIFFLDLNCLESWSLKVSPKSTSFSKHLL